MCEACVSNEDFPHADLSVYVATKVLFSHADLSVLCFKPSLKVFPPM